LKNFTKLEPGYKIFFWLQKGYKMKWKTIAEYAESQGVSRAAVYKAIKIGRIRTNGKEKKFLRVDGSVSLSETRTQEPDNIPANPEKKPVEKKKTDQVDIFSATAKAKLMKLKAEVELKNQQIQSNRKSMIRNIAMVMMEGYSTSFSPLKQVLIELRLPEEAIKKIKETVAGCAVSFDAFMLEKIEDEASDLYK